MKLRPLSAVLALFVTIGAMVAMASDFHAYQRMTPGGIRAVLPSSLRTVIDLSGPWQRSVRGTSTGSVNLPCVDPADETVVYSRQVRVDQATLQRHAWQLYFLGVSDEVELRVNGRTIQRYPGGLAPFSVRIPERTLVNGTNTVELVVAPIGQRTALIERNARHGQRVGMGVLREVFLVGTPHVWTSEVRTTSTINGGSATVSVRTTVSGTAVERLTDAGADGALAAGTATVDLDVTLATADGTVVARSTPRPVSVERSRSVTTTTDLTVVAPKLWSPANPSLYTCTVRLQSGGRVIDDISTNVGIRTIRVGRGERGRQVFVNDSAMLVQAVEYMEEYPRVGISMSAAQMEYDVALMKTLGVNTVRVRHGAPHPYFLHLCDTYGLFVIAELPAADVPTSLLAHDDVQARLRNAAERLVSGLDAHPALLAYGLSDGLEESSPEVAGYHADVRKILRGSANTLLVKSIDPGSLPMVSEGGFDLIILRFTTLDDIASLPSIVRQATKTIRDAAILACVGSFVSPNSGNGYSDPRSAEAQAVRLRDAYKTSIAAGLGGIVVWTFNDYRLERPALLVDTDEPYIATSGLVDQWRQPRVAYSMYKALINDEKEPLLQARDYSADTPLVFIVTGIVLALILVFLINRSRRFREYLLRAILRPYNFYADIRDQRILSAVQTAILGMVIASCVGLVLASLLYFLRTDALVEYILHLTIPSNGLFDLLRFIAWRPSLAVITFSAAVFGMLLLLAVILRLGAMFVKGRIFFRDTLTIAVWSSLPLVLLLPIGVALYQVLSTDAMSLWIPAVIAGVVLWIILRALRATSVVFDVRAGLVYLTGFILLAVTLGTTIWWCDAQYELYAFLRHYAAVVAS